MHTPPAQWQANSGVSLLEVLIALAILIVGIIGAVQLFPRALEQVQRANESTVVSRVAASRLDEAHTAGGRDLMLRRIEGRDRLRSFPPRHRGPVDAVQAAGGMYSGYTSSVQRMRGAAGVYLQRVSFNVKMPDGRTEQYVTYVTRR